MSLTSCVKIHKLILISKNITIKRMSRAIELRSNERLKIWIGQVRNISNNCPAKPDLTREKTKEERRTTLPA